MTLCKRSWQFTLLAAATLMFSSCAQKISVLGTLHAKNSSGAIEISADGQSIRLLDKQSVVITIENGTLDLFSAGESLKIKIPNKNWNSAAQTLDLPRSDTGLNLDLKVTKTTSVAGPSRVEGQLVADINNNSVTKYECVQTKLTRLVADLGNGEGYIEGTVSIGDARRPCDQFGHAQPTMYESLRAIIFNR